VSVPTDADAFPILDRNQLSRLRGYGTTALVETGELLFHAGQSSYDFIVLETASSETFREADGQLGETVLARHGPGQFLGELNLLTGQATYLGNRVVTPGAVIRIAPAEFRELMDRETELSDFILRALISRRHRLRVGDAALSIELVGSAFSAQTMTLRTWLARQQIPHTFVEADLAEGAALMRALGLTADELPVLTTPDQTFRRATAALVSASLGLTFSAPSRGRILDLIVVGGGPAGLAAAVYGA
jgi:thioredoxin reductase (NADPH)